MFGEDRLRDFDLKVNEEVTVSFDIDAHEYQGRWYNDITVWRVQRGVVDAGAPAAPVASAPAPAAAPAPTAAPAASSFEAEGTADDLPF